MPRQPLFAAAAAGTVVYDPAEEALCVQAVAAEACHGISPWFDVPHCAAAFTCADAGAGGADAARSEGGTDAGDAGAFVTCPSLTYTGPPLTPCTSSSACDGGVCAFGYCGGGASQFPPVDDGGISFVGIGEPCDSDPPFLGGSYSATPAGKDPSRFCTPGATCRGLSADGGFGTCEKANDVGGECDVGALSTGCAAGLLCQCGVCVLPPQTGPCDGNDPLSCQLGVSYCAVDGGAAACQPLNGVGGDCSQGLWQCDLDLQCPSPFGGCQPYSQ